MLQTKTKSQTSVNQKSLKRSKRDATPREASPPSNKPPKRETSSSCTMAIFHAARRPNAKGEYNWLEWKQCSKIDLSCLQEHVGGHITLLPCRQKHSFVAYARDDGLMDPDYARNDLAAGALAELGFGGHELLGLAYAGTVVVVGTTPKGNDRGLREKECETLKSAICSYRKKMEASEHDTDESEDDVEYEIKL